MDAGGRRRRGHRILAVSALLAAGLSAVAACTVAGSVAAPVVRGAGRAVSGTWVTSWSASPQPALPGAPAAAGRAGRTVRDIVFTSAGGSAIRLELSNAYGTGALRVAAVTVAVAGRGADVLPGTVRPVRFGGSRAVDIPPGGRALSDPVAMRVPALRDLAVSLYLPEVAWPATVHRDAQQVNWVAPAGDHSGDILGGAFTRRTVAWYFLSAVLVWSHRAAGTVVTFGDSITDGMRSVTGANTRWPNDLARRLAAASGPGLAVADAGISGNRLLHQAECCGPSAMARFQRDALGQPGVRDVIVLEGINDIGDSAVRPNPRVNPVTAVTAGQIIAGYQRLIALAHARGVRVFGATLLPFEGAGYYTPAGEAKREAVNAWIRDSGAFDGVIDFDVVMRDPADPLRLSPRYDSGDHLHPNDAGYAAMARAVSLPALLAAPGPPPEGARHRPARELAYRRPGFPGAAAAANRRQAPAVIASSGPVLSVLSRTRIARAACPTSTQFPPLPPL